jgi:hypothetical protein
MSFADGEPHRWVTSVLQEGVRPVPDYDVHAISVGNGRHVAVIEVSPLEAGPCIVRGTVYERVAGASVPVKDPTRLADLYSRGRAAHESARTRAQRALGQALLPFDAFEPEVADPYDAYPDEDEPEILKSLFVVLAVAAVGQNGDPGALLFRASTRELLEKVAVILSSEPAPLVPEVRSAVAQDRRTTLAVSPRVYRPDWALSAFWDASVVVAMRAPSFSGGMGTLVDDNVLPAYRAAVEIGLAIGAEGPSYLRLSVVDPLSRLWPEPVLIGRGPAGLTVDALDVAWLTRELNRTIGVDDPEPDT